MVRNADKRGVALSSAGGTAGFETVRLLYLHEELSSVQVWGSQEGKGNIAVLQMQLQPPYLVTILVNKRNPHSNESVRGRKPQLIPLLLFQLKIQRREDLHNVERETCLQLY